MVPQQDNIIFFQGDLDFERIGVLITDLKKKAHELHFRPSDYKKLLALTIEVLENIQRYTEHFMEFVAVNPQYLPTFRLTSGGKVFMISSCNPVMKKDIDRLKERIRHVNHLEQESLKAFYRETITNGIFSEKGGAGLGFIEMAKITGHPIDFSFEPVHEDYSLFSLDLTLNKSG